MEGETGEFPEQTPPLVPIACKKYGLASKKCTNPTHNEWVGFAQIKLSKIFFHTPLFHFYKDGVAVYFGN